jgi:hypothetical protein
MPTWPRPAPRTVCTSRRICFSTGWRQDVQGGRGFHHAGRFRLRQPQAGASCRRPGSSSLPSSPTRRLRPVRVIAAARIFPAMIVPGSGAGDNVNINTAHATVTAAPADNAVLTFIGAASANAFAACRDPEAGGRRQHRSADPAGVGHLHAASPVEDPADCPHVAAQRFQHGRARRAVRRGAECEYSRPRLRIARINGA